MALADLTVADLRELPKLSRRGLMLQGFIYQPIFATCDACAYLTKLEPHYAGELLFDLHCAFCGGWKATVDGDVLYQEQEPPFTPEDLNNASLHKRIRTTETGLDSVFEPED